MQRQTQPDKPPRRVQITTAVSSNDSQRARVLVFKEAQGKSVKELSVLKRAVKVKRSCVLLRLNL